MGVILFKVAPKAGDQNFLFQGLQWHPKSGQPKITVAGDENR